MQAIVNYLNRDYTWQKLAFLCIAAFFIRFVTFQQYIQYEERYRQADSFDYHLCAVCIKNGNGMSRFDRDEPIFWRTPGYPLFLSIFYYWYDIKQADFSPNSAPQKAALILQIIICSIIPLLIFFLARLLIGSLLISWIAAWISVFHLGFVLASCFILSDALAHVLFLGFLYFFYQSFQLWFEPLSKKITSSFFLWNTALAALLLNAYTWLRPNGQFLVVVVFIVFLLGNCPWQIKVSKIVLFGSLFFMLLSGWYIRNHNLTGQWFFCPMFGPYLQTFCVPKIIRRLTDKSLDDCLRYTFSLVSSELRNETARLAREASHLYVSKELICLKLSVPWILKYPWYFICDWIKEVTKTTFDLYGAQLVSLVNKTHTWDPTEEFLLEKLAFCLWKQPMPWIMRIICWLDALLYLLLWIGIVSGCWFFFIHPLITGQFENPSLQKIQAQWIKMGIIAGALIVMTGGFGYARLRMAIDPLLIIMSLTAWYSMLVSYISHQKRDSYEPTLRPVAHGLHTISRKIKR